MVIENQEIELFIHHLKTERRLSSHTIAAYSRDLVKLKEFSRKRQLDSWQKLNTCSAGNARSCQPVDYTDLYPS